MIISNHSKKSREKTNHALLRPLRIGRHVLAALQQELVPLDDLVEIHLRPARTLHELARLDAHLKTSIV